MTTKTQTTQTADTNNSHDTMGLTKANTTATARQIAFFRTIPWCAALLSNPSLVIDQAVSRYLTHTPRDVLISRTLNRADAIPAYITFYSTGSATPTPSQSQPTATTTTPTTPTTPAPAHQTDKDGLIKEIHALLALGPALNGWEGLCHGGIVTTLLDEVMGQVFSVNRNEGRLPADGPPALTGYLNTTFLKPVRTGTALQGGLGEGTRGAEGIDVKGAGVGEENAGAAGEGNGPAVVLITGRLLKREGRKYWLEAVLEKEGGVVLAKAEAMFVVLRERL
ncbi:acyl-coenzyme A thioesterase THEM4 [Dichotomopilus funicola]|uniref:Acyl-coenzyme A thioesterase THEM4 n=1 Tax=Dichotomopilus funicola TaxID=1934379 RepID=A0AAN6UWC2_9PEZI|nr:acyl-coenzyme A thioesterase THEM4 [Dichotomopilus funicola]